MPPLTICVAGTAGSGKSRLIAELREASHGDLTLLKARLSNLAIEPSLIDRLRDANWVEAPDYTSWAETEAAATGPDPVGGRRAVRGRPADPASTPASRATRPTSPSPRPGTAGSSSIPATRSRRPWSC